MVVNSQVNLEGGISLYSRPSRVNCEKFNFNSGILFRISRTQSLATESTSGFSSDEEQEIKGTLLYICFCC